MNEPTLSHRKTELTLKYAIKTAAYSDNPTHDFLFSKQLNSNQNLQIKSPKPIGIIIKEYQSEILNQFPPVLAHKLSPVPPWILKTPKVNLNLTKLKKNEMSGIQWIQIYKELEEKYKYSIEIFTDGSKIETGIGCSVFSYLEELYIGLPT